MRENRIRRWLIAGAIFIVAAIPAFASGFSIYEQDAKASAQAGAWTARASNAAANWYNPAALVRQESSFQIGVNAITLGADTTFTSGIPLPGAPAGTEFNPESSIATPVHLYYVQKVNDRVAWGFGINTPFGLTTEWTTPPITFAARKSELATVVFNPNVSLAFDEHFSLGFGINYMYADLTHFSRDVTTPALGTQDLTGTGTDWGLNLALHYDDENFKFGISWRMGLSPTIEGDLTFNGTRVDGGKADLDLPDQIAAGLAYTRPEKWDLELDVSWARWSTFQALDLQFDNLPPESVKENWDDTYAIRLGGSYDLGQRHEIRYGVLRDMNPIPDETLRPSIPDADRWSGTVGYGYIGSKVDIDFYYMALIFDDRTLEPSLALEPGAIPGEYTNFSHLLGVTFGWRFGGGS